MKTWRRQTSPRSRARLTSVGLALAACGALLLAACGGAGTSVQKTTPVPPQAKQPAQTSPAAPPAETKAGASPAAQSAASPQAKAEAKAGAPAPELKTTANYLLSGPAPELALYAFAVALGKEVTEKSGGKLNITVTSSGGGPDALRRVIAGEHHLSTNTPAPDAYDAYSGTGTAKDREPAQKLRALWIWNVAPFIMAVRKDSGITTFPDLAGKRVATGRSGSLTERVNKALLDENNVQIDQYRGGIDDLTRATQDGEIVGFGQAGPGLATPDGNILSVHATTPLNFLSIPPDWQQKWKETHTDASIVTVPANTYPGQTEAIDVLGVAIQVSTTTDVPEDAAYHITKTAFEQRDALDASYPALRGVDWTQLTLEHGQIPLHKGAARYFEEVLGVQLPDKLRPPD